MGKDEKDVMWPIYNLLKHGEIDYNALNRDFVWTSIRCDDLRSMFELVRVVKPTKGIRSLKIAPRGEEPEVCIMSEMDFDSLLTVIEKEMNRGYVGDHYQIQEMNIEETPNRVLFQLMLNSLANNSLVDYSNAEGRFYKVVTHEDGTGGLKGCVAKYIAMEFRIVDSPEYLHGFSDICLDFSVTTFNNAFRSKINWGKRGSKAFTRYQYVKGSGMQTVSKKDDGTTFVNRGVKGEKSTLKMLDYTASGSGSRDARYAAAMKHLKESRATVIMEVVKRFDATFGEYVGGISLCRDEVTRIPTKLDDSYDERLIEHFRGQRIHLHDLTGDAKYAGLVQEFIETMETRYGVELHRSTSNRFWEHDISILLPKDEYKTGKEDDEGNEDRDDDPYAISDYYFCQHLTTERLEKALREYRSQCKKKQADYERKLKEWLDGEDGRSPEDYPEKGPTPAKMSLAEVLLEQLYIKEEIHNGKMEFYRWADENYEGTWEFAIPLISKGSKACIGYATFAVEPDGSMLEPTRYAPSDPHGPKEYSRIDWKDVEYAVKDPSGHVNVVRMTEIRTIPDAERVMEMLKENKVAGRGRTVGLKDGEHLPELFGGSVDIGYREIAPGRWIYYVGQQNMNMTVANASVIREIEAIDGGDVFFDRLFPMMSVPFIKHRQNSVIPFPVKYLREWCAILGFFEEEENEKTA